MAQIQQENDRLNLAPKKFVLWLFVFASFMIFAALTSGFMVYAGGKGHGLNVQLPDAFMYSISLFLRLLLDVCYNYNIYMLNMFNFKLVKSFLVFGVGSTRTLIRDPF